jgi:putative DNA primase/helicase
LLPVPVLDMNMLPIPFADWLDDIRDRIGCPLEYVVVPAIVAAAAVVGRKVAIRPKQQDDWTVIPNLWGAIVGRPGALKSPAIQEALTPLHRLVRAAEAEFSARSAEFEASYLIAEQRHRADRESYRAARRRRTQNAEEIEELEARIRTPPDPTAPIRRRYLVNDTTVEKLVEILRENPNGVLAYRDELAGWLRTLDKQGHETDRAFYLEAWNGNGAFVCDRIGRGTVRVDAVSLSILGGIQPGPLSSYLRAAANGAGKENDGLVTRLQLLVYPDCPTSWRNVDEYPDVPAKNRAFDVYQRLDNLNPETVGAQIDELRDDPPYLRFDPEAQELFNTWRTTLENRFVSTQDESPLIESHLAKYRSLMPSLALLFHLVDVVGRRATGPVSVESAQRAVGWCALLEAHMRRVYHASFDNDPEPARMLIRRVLAGRIESPFTARDIVQKGWSGLDTTDEVERALATLERFDWIRRVEVATGGRPKTLVYVNPLAFEEAAP